jgi:hypothetical protein
MKCNVYLSEIDGTNQCQDCGSHIHYKCGLNSEAFGHQELSIFNILFVIVKQTKCSENNVQKLSESKQKKLNFQQELAVHDKILVFTKRHHNYILSLPILNVWC